MKAVIEAVFEGKGGIYIIRIYRKEGSLYDVYVVDEIELKTCIQDTNFRDTLTGCSL